MSRIKISFNVSYITLVGDTITMTRVEKINKTNIPSDQENFKIEREMEQYVRFNCRSDVWASVKINAPGLEPTTPEESKI